MYRKILIFLLITLIFLSNLAAGVLAFPLGPNGRHPASGVYGVWGPSSFSGYPWLVGAQVYASWKDINPQEGTYNWSGFDNRAKARANAGKLIYLQINSSPSMPSWIFNHVAKGNYTNTNGFNPPQFWDPVYINIYKKFIQDYANHIANSSYKDKVVLVRAQFNAWNPEDIDPKGHYSYQDYIPTSSGHRYNVNYTVEIGNNYAREITKAFYDAFTPLGIYVVQKPFGGALRQVHLADEWAEMGAGLFATNNRPNPSHRLKFEELVKDAQATRAFSEDFYSSGSSAYKNISRTQFVYWRGLSALHQGCEFISFYGSDVTNTSFKYLFNFINKYTGYYREPEQSPGAWIAFRDIRNENNSSSWTHLEGDYEFLIEQIEPLNTVGLFAYSHDGDKEVNFLNPLGKPTTYLGPDSQKEGIWARRTDKSSGNNDFYLDVNNTYAASLSGNITIRIVYFDKGTGGFNLIYKDGSSQEKLKSFSKSNSNTWKEVQVNLDSYRMNNGLSKNADLILNNAGDDDDTFHMVEIKRNSPPVTVALTPTPTTEPTVPGDADNDGNVDIDDYIIWVNNYNQNKYGPTFGDFNNTGKVDGLDYIIWLTNYGT
jgi:hypothetical protein